MSASAQAVAFSSGMVTRAFALSVVLVLASSSMARAQDTPTEEESSATTLPDRPTSGDFSISSGRTLGIRRKALAAGIGWPGVWAEFDTGLSSRFTLGVRATVLYGSPLLGFGNGIGGELSVPIRLHIYGHQDLDVSIALRPAIVMGQGSLVGLTNTFRNDFGFGVRGEGGLLLGMRLTDAVTFVLGVNGGLGFNSVPDAERSHVLALIRGVIGVEALVSRDTMLFAVADGGYGFAPSDTYEKHVIVGLSLGLAYEL